MQNKDVLAIIPARAGSKGLPGKNTICLHGRPLVCWTIDAAIKSQCFSRIVVTSNDNEVLGIAAKYGGVVTSLLRPEELCGDDVPGVSVALHAINSGHVSKYAMFLQPTSPLRSHKDIREACALGIQNNLKSVVSLTEVQKHPNWMFNVDEKNRTLSQYDKQDLHKIRQTIPKLYQLNGAIYLFDTEWMEQVRTLVSKDSRGYIMPFERSVDIDTKYDLMLAEQILSESNSI